MPGRAVPVWRARTSSVPAGLTVAVGLSVALHLAGMLPIRISPNGVSVPGPGQPVLTRMIYVEAESKANPPAMPVEAEPAPAAAPAREATPLAVPAPTQIDDPVRVAQRPAERQRAFPVAKAVAPQALHAEARMAEAPSPPVTPKPVAAEPAPALPTLPPAPAYASAATLDPPPRPLDDIDPEYPKAAGLRQGVVVLRLLIDEAGHVDNVAVVRSSPKGLFEESALAAFGKAAFSPGRLLGVAVKSQWTVEVEFTPVNRGASVAGRDY